jgi:hypothetical protein
MNSQYGVENEIIGGGYARKFFDQHALFYRNLFWHSLRGQSLHDGGIFMPRVFRDGQPDAQMHGRGRDAAVTEGDRRVYRGIRQPIAFNRYPENNL